MIRLLILPAFLLTGACQTRLAISCENAATVRAAAVMTIRTIDRACPIP